MSDQQLVTRLNILVSAYAQLQCGLSKLTLIGLQDQEMRWEERPIARQIML
jgi:hypothetical protein